MHKGKKTNLTRSQATEMSDCQGIPAMKRKERKIKPTAEYIAGNIGLDKGQQK